MLRLTTDLLQPGMILAKPVVDERGHVLLRQGVCLTEEYVAKLRRRGFSGVYIDDGDTNDVVIEDMISDEVRRSAQATLARVFDFSKQISSEFALASSDTIVACIQNNTVKDALRSEEAFKQLEEVVTTIVRSLSNNDMLTGITQIRSHDDVTFGHSIDMTVTAVMIAKRLFISQRDQERLAAGCMLHDVGKIFVSPKILRKSQPLTPAELSRLREHPRLGYELLRSRNPDGVMTNHVALQHHERQDGRGYPRHLHGVNTIERSKHDRENILLIAEIATVADVYDVLSVDKPGQPAPTPRQTADTMRRLAGTFLNREITQLFLSMLPILPAGMHVVVRNGNYQGYKGVVVQPNRKIPERPQIRLLFDTHGKRITPVDLDLGQNNNIEVEATLR